VAGNTIAYVYGVVAGAAVQSDDAPAAPHPVPDGVEGAPVRIVPVRDGMGALVSGISAEVATSVAERGGDAAWLAPRAIAHDAVVTWAADVADGAIVPFPMWVMASDDHGVVGMIAGREAELRAMLGTVSGAREYVIRVSADAGVIAREAARLEPSLAALEESASRAAPGQAYLLRRKLSEARRGAIRDIAARVATETDSTLAAESRERARTASEVPGIVLDAAYLVAGSAYERFREQLSGLVERYGASGFRFEFTGPWPPYHFTRAH